MDPHADRGCRRRGPGRRGGDAPLDERVEGEVLVLRWSFTIALARAPASVVDELRSTAARRRTASRSVTSAALGVEQTDQPGHPDRVAGSGAGTASPQHGFTVFDSGFIEFVAQLTSRAGRLLGGSRPRLVSSSWRHPRDHRRRRSRDGTPKPFWIAAAAPTETSPAADCWATSPSHGCSRASTPASRRDRASFRPGVRSAATPEHPRCVP